MLCDKKSLFRLEKGFSVIQNIPKRQFYRYTVSGFLQQPTRRILPFRKESGIGYLFFQDRIYIFHIPLC
jgi:hypothetical protein